MTIKAKVVNRAEYEASLAAAREAAGPLLSELTYCQLEDVLGTIKTFVGPRAEPMIVAIEGLMTAITADEHDGFEDDEEG